MAVQTSAKVCCLNRALQRPETNLPVTYQTFALVLTPIIARFQELFSFPKVVNTNQSKNLKCRACSSWVWWNGLVLSVEYLFPWPVSSALISSHLPTSCLGEMAPNVQVSDHRPVHIYLEALLINRFKKSKKNLKIHNKPQ